MSRASKSKPNAEVESAAGLTITFEAVLQRPAVSDPEVDWAFLRLPAVASEPLSSRGLVSVEGTFQGEEFAVTLEPDGEGGHWMRVSRDLQRRAGAAPGDRVRIEISPARVEPEPEVPVDLADALRQSPSALETWSSITAIARRDWIHWIISGKRAETRIKRVEVAMSKLAAGSRRPCCFDRSGMYSKEFKAPEAAPLSDCDPH